MNWRDIPPLAALRAFAAYAETRSVTKAGAALNVSHAAISQQMRVLERHLGVPLLDRSSRSLALTPDGERLARVAQDGFAAIAEVTASLTGAEADRPLHITTTPSFAANWLMPRLAGFRIGHPDARLVIDPSPGLHDPAPGGIDLAIRYGNGSWAGLMSEPLVPSPIVVVAAPSLIGSANPERPEDILHFPWLQELGRNETSGWLSSRGVEDKHPATVTQVPGNLMIDGARGGQGIAVTTLIAVAEDVQAGRLRVLFEEPDDDGYHLVMHPGAPRPALRDFIRWIRAEARSPKGSA